MAVNVEKFTNMASELCDRFWTWRMDNFPEFATSIGKHENDDKLMDMTIESFIKRQQEADDFLQQAEHLLQKIQKGLHQDCQKENQVLDNLTLLRFELLTFVKGFQYHTYLCPISNLEGPQVSFADLLVSMPQRTSKDYQNILSRLSALPTLIDDIITLMREGIERKITLHHYSLGDVTSQFQKLMTSSLDNCPLYKCFLDKPEYLATEDWSWLVEQCKCILVEDIYPSFQRIIDFIDGEYLQNTRKDISVMSLPKGRCLYSAYLKYHTSTDLTPEQIHNIGLLEVERIKVRAE